MEKYFRLFYLLIEVGCAACLTGCFHERDILVFDDEHFELVSRTSHNTLQRSQDREEFIDNWIYDFWERPKRLYKDSTGRLWVIHGGVFQRQQFVAFLLGGLYELALSPEITPQYFLLEDYNDRLLLGSPFIPNFKTFANYFKGSADNNQLEAKVTDFLKAHPETRLEDWVALEIWTGESDMHPYNLGIVEIAPGEFRVTRVGNQHALVGLNEQSARTNACDLEVILHYPLENTNYLMAVEQARGWELLAQSFEYLAMIPDEDLRAALNDRLEPLRKRGIVVPSSTGLSTAPLISGFDQKLLSEVDSTYRVKSVQQNYYPDKGTTQEIFDTSWKDYPVWRVTEEEVQAVIDELIARKALFPKMAESLRNGSLR